MTFVGLDLNSTRVSAVSGPAGTAPRELALDGQNLGYSMTLSLEGRHPEPGRAGAALCRRLPHLACLNFLPHVGDPHQWGNGRRRVDAEHAVSLVLERVQPVLAGVEGIGLALPPYFGHVQRERLGAIFDKMTARRRAKLPPLLGTTAAPLAAVSAASAEQPCAGLVLVGDVDDHALTWSTVDAAGQEASLLTEQSLPQLNLRTWKGKLLDAVAERCIRQSRRDLRESGQAEQGLYDQFDAALEACRQGRLIDLAIQGERWYQNLILRPDDFVDFSASLVRQAVDAVAVLAATTMAGETIRTVLLTAAAGRLPGLATAVEAKDFSVTILPSDAVARGAHDVAVRVHRGDMPSGHFGSSLHLSASDAAAGPAYQRVISIRAVER